MEALLRKEQELTLKQSLRTLSIVILSVFSLEEGEFESSGVHMQYIPRHKFAPCFKQGTPQKREDTFFYLGSLFILPLKEVDSCFGFLRISPKFTALQHGMSGSANRVWWVP